jgi:hypothetical protein
VTGCRVLALKNPKGLAAVESHPFGFAQGRLLGTKRPRMGHPPLDDADENQELLKGGPPASLDWWSSIGGYDGRSKVSGSGARSLALTQ